MNNKTSELANPEKSSFLRAKLPIYAVSFNSMDNFVLSVSMSGLIRAFPEARESTLMYLLSITMLTSIVGGFVFSILSARFSKKALVSTALLVGCICAAIYIIFPSNLPVLFVASIIQGVVAGFIATAFPLLVNTHIVPAERSKVMGIGSGMVQFGRLATFVIAGFLANLQWNFVFFAYIFMLIAFFIVIFLLPGDTPSLQVSTTAKNNLQMQKEIGLELVKNKGFWQLMLVAFLFGITNFLASSHVSLYIEGYGLGLPSITGLLTGLSCAVAGIVGMLFSKIFKFTRRKTHAIGFIIMGVGFILAGLFIGLPFILIAVAFTMVASAINLPFTLLCVFRVSSEKTSAMVAALVPTLLNAGSFLSPMIMNGMASGFGDGSPAAAYLYGGILTVIVGIAILLLLKKIIYDKDQRKAAPEVKSS